MKNVLKNKIVCIFVSAITLCNIFSLKDPSRLYYEPNELQIFENIECEWPLFFCYLLIDSIFQKNKEATVNYNEALEKVNTMSKTAA